MRFAPGSQDAAEPATDLPEAAAIDELNAASVENPAYQPTTSAPPTRNPRETEAATPPAREWWTHGTPAPTPVGDLNGTGSVTPDEAASHDDQAPPSAPVQPDGNLHDVVGQPGVRVSWADALGSPERFAVNLSDRRVWDRKYHEDLHEGEPTTQTVLANHQREG